MRIQIIAPSCAIVLALGLTPAPATAVSAQRAILQMAPGLCGANNPANDPYLRRLPTGLRNGSGVTVSVVCSLWGDSEATSYVSLAYVYFANHSANPVNVPCTLTMGRPRDVQTAATRVLGLAAGQVAATTWNSADYGTDLNKQWVNLQCSLPPGVEMRGIGANMYEDIGA